MTLGNNETTPSGRDSLLDEFTKASECQVSETSLRREAAPGEFTKTAESWLSETNVCTELCILRHHRHSDDVELNTDDVELNTDDVTTS